MAMVNMNNLLNGKDSRWLQLEVCREFQRNKCSRPDTECKFAHPPANVEVQNGRVTACYDSIKGRCNREKPPCKYFHPPQHLKDQLLINGRNHLALKNALMQQMGLSPGQPLVPGQVQAVVDTPIDRVPLTFFPHLLTTDDPFALMAANPYLTGMPQVGSTYSHYFTPGPIMPAIMGHDPTGVGSPLGVVPQTVVAQQKVPRSDRLEMDMKSVGSFYYDNFAFPAGMVPYKRPAADKSGVPVYQPTATTYQQLMQLQQPFVPVSCEYSTAPAPPPTTSCTSPTIGVTEAAAAVAQHSAVVSAVASHHQLQHQQHQQQLSKENDNQIPIPASVVTSAPLPPPLPQTPHPQTTAIHDPAALAKEVAQQNYAKALKLAAMNQSLASSQSLAAASQSLHVNQSYAAANQSFAASQSLAASQFGQLNPLNYTGVALNKQAMGLQQLRYPASLPLGLSAAGMNFNSLAANPYAAAALAQQNYLNMTRPQTAHALFNPYSILRPQYSLPPASVNATPMLNSNLLAATQYPVTASAAPAMTNVTASTYTSAAAAQNNNNNNVVMQPYKKLKTT